MKKVVLLLITSFLLAILGSCSSDDSQPILPDQTGDETVDPIPEEPSSNPDEEVILDPNTVSQGLTIDGSTRNTGNPPAPTGSGLTFTISNTNQSAFLKSGFDIVFNEPAGYAGSYIQTKSKDGKLASDYIDVPKSATRSAKMNENEIEIDVNFANDVPPGKFCYLICVYDEAGNISDPIEVCVEIEAWAGNPELIGSWNYTKEVRDGNTILLGDINFCEGPDTITCNNSSTITISPEDAWCYATTSLSLEFKEDGTYILTDVNVQKQEFLYPASLESCSPVTEVVVNDKGDTDISKGNWAYDEEEKTLTLVEFEDTVIDNETGVPDTIIDENGYVFYINGGLTINGSELIITIDYTPIETEVNSSFYFTK